MNKSLSRILVIQNDDIVPIGDFGKALQQLGCKLTTHHSYIDSLDSLATADFNGLVVLGGRMSAFDDDQAPFLAGVVDLIKEYHRQQKPIFGICLGAQLLARAFGGEYRSNDGWEVAFTDLSINQVGQQDPVLSGLPETLSMYEMHQDTLELPFDAQLLITGKHCQNQAFRVGQFSYGVQFHPEATADIVNGWADRVATNLDETTRPIHQAMLNTTKNQFLNQQKICNHLAAKWLTLVHKQMV
ncbi:type 1 glutamine amidotransferase [Vibrio tapetis]|uniref:Putative Class I glutamine amidotransferase n=1 Tax=Vibrio tapetis subsp. tapetis TaxID=1671868 RepID=A0A2N8ZMI9_9VIBR|nr:type 1 glutamine amidotransferase [Vibrio tapetis]SON53082.1 putative Class I glutamine amidotransferase [Vibrio tapetis subsp. tapetis]